MSSDKAFVIKLPEVSSSVFKKINKDPNKNLILSKTICYPSVELGYHSFLHRTKNAMEITNKLDTKTKFYYVVNPYEHKISDYENDLSSYTKKYFKMTKEDPNIMSRAFYKMWEMIYYFDLVSKKDLTYAALAEGPGSFLQAVLKFREKYDYNLKNDKYFGVTIHAEDGKNIEMGKQFMGYYKDRYPDLLNIHKTYPSKKAKTLKSRSDGDITQVKTISLFKKDISKSKKFADLVTADGGFDWQDENFQEQEAYQLILGEIVAALRVQSKGGNFVLKLFETLTISSLKMIYIASTFYGDVYICKPLFSRESNSEKYLICKGFKYDQKDDKKKLDERINILEDILERMSSNLFLQDIIPDFEVPEDYKNVFRFINTEIANKQQIMINKIVTYIKKNNYFGDLYHEYKNSQIEETSKWIKKFFTEKYNKNIESEIKKSIDFNSQEEIQFNKN